MLRRTRAKFSLAGADSVSMILSTSGDDLTEGGEIPTYAEASTPEWSEVEQGNVVSPVGSQDSEIELIGLDRDILQLRYGHWT